ncbi:MAG: zinc-dependent alcohol dehydrogenase family protein [Spirochaetaceae bacterium]|jgi:2-desacetyl-2-hydroxyethyl bacteriochlorophyllide A dehydrogenase|nr:zinc-dependent alcohol dehydrogenase family protein [Spirochaetaceae bacterium]
MDMKALVIEKPGNAHIKTIPVRPVGDLEVKIQVKASGICGTDVHIYRGEYLGSYPVIPGHEFSGVVVETGKKVTRFKPGNHVAIEPNINCDNCHACLNNRQNFCEHWDGVGVTLPGGMAEYAVVPEKAVFNIGTLPFLSGAFVEPLSCVLHGVQRARIQMADRVAILGAGPIGLLLSKAIQLQGASDITQVDKNQSRLELARTSGARQVCTSLDELDLEGYDVVVEAAGSAFLMEQSLRYVRKGGTLLWFGVPKGDAQVTLPAFTLFEKGLIILTSYTSVRNSIQAVRLLESGRIDVSALVSHQLPLEEFSKGIEIIEQGIEGVLKVVILPNGSF